MKNYADTVDSAFLSYAKKFSRIMLVLDKKGCIKQVYSDEDDFFTEPLAQLVGKNWFESYIPKYACEKAMAAFNSIKQSHHSQIEQHIYPILAPNHKERMISWHSTPQFNEKNQLISIWMAGYELRSSDLVHDAEERNTVTAQAILDHAVEGIITIDTQGALLSFNHAAEHLFGYKAEEVIGQNIKVLMPSPYKEKHDIYLNNYLSTGQKKIIGVGREVTGLHKNGNTFPIELSVTEVNVGLERNFVGIIRDISERKQAQEQLKQRDQELQSIRDRMAHMDRLNVMGEMATGIAHELNQPLTAIATYAQASNYLLDTAIKNTNDLSHSLNQINEQAQRAGEVIRRLRAMVTKQTPTRKLVDVKTLIIEALELAKTDSRIKDISIETDFTDDKLLVEIDSIQIQQVVLNLIRNAIDAMEENPKDKLKRIIIKAERQEKCVCVTVIDSGSGLLDITASEVFNPFSSTKNHGMGMGLAICQSIILAHDGKISFNAENKQGTEFYFTLPLLDEPEDR